MRKPYHLTITDNRTGEVYRDTDADALIGAIHTDENETGQIFLSECTGVALGQLMVALDTIQKQAHSEIPDLELLSGIVRARMRQTLTDYAEK